jgi:hypothetical protein
MQTLTVYWYAFKYWLGGASWEESMEVATRLVYWPGGNY